ncbi:hypothetical protein ACJX0J_041533, partial [Zea mays]
VLQRRMIARRGEHIAQIKVRWSGMAPELATWEDATALQVKFPAAPAWGQAGFQERENVSNGVDTVLPTKENALEGSKMTKESCGARKRITNPKYYGPRWAVLRQSLKDNNNVLQSWDPTLVNPCTWIHVTCNPDHIVIRPIGFLGLLGYDSEKASSLRGCILNHINHGYKATTHNMGLFPTVQLNLVAYNFWNNAFVCYCYCIGFCTVLPLNAHHVPQLD